MDENRASKIRQGVMRGRELATEDIAMMSLPWNVLCSLQATARRRVNTTRMSKATWRAYWQTIRRSGDNS